MTQQTKGQTLRKHSDGPWRLGRQEFNEQGGAFLFIDAPQWGDLASVVIRMDGEESNSAEGKANARLIAAAPELLTALESLLLPEGSISLPNHHRYVQAARAAIAAAKEGK